MRRIIIIALALIVIVGFLIWKFGPSFSKTEKKADPNKPVTLNFWGLWEDESYYKPAIDAYIKMHPNVKINYKREVSLNYRTRVQTQITGDQGPDIFMIHNSWVPMFLNTNSVAQMPSSVMSLSEYSTTFYPVALQTLTNYPVLKYVIDNSPSIADKQKALTDQFSQGGKIYGMPLEIDGLALYYNEDILQAAGVTVPKTWDQLREAALRVTVKDAKGVIKTAGLGIGEIRNVDHWSDILGLLFSQQPGTNLEKPTSSLDAEVLSFYTSFVTDPKLKVWDDSLEPSTQAFYLGKLAFYFGPSWRAQEIHTANPQLKFKIVPVPQLPNRNASWASFWALAVSNKSANQKEAFEFLKYLTSADSEKLIYQQAASVRLFGEPYSRVDLGQTLLLDPWVGPFISQAPNYKSWYLSSNTMDGGINDETMKYYEDAVNATLAGTDPNEALQTVAKGLQEQIFPKYYPGVVAASPQQ